MIIYDVVAGPFTIVLVVAVDPILMCFAHTGVHINNMCIQAYKYIHFNGSCKYCIIYKVLFNSIYNHYDSSTSTMFFQKKRKASNGHLWAGHLPASERELAFFMVAFVISFHGDYVGWRGISIWPCTAW